ASLPGGWIVLVGPTLLVIATGLLVIERRASLLPEEFRGALSLLIAPLAADAMFLGLAYLAAFRIRRIQGGRTRPCLSYIMLVLLAYALTLMGVGGALSASHLISGGLGFAAFAVGLLASFLPVVILALGSGRLSNEELTAGDNTPDDCWKWGFM